MNKLLVSDIINLKNDSYVLECLNNKLKMIIEGNTTVYLVDQILNELNIEIKDGSNLNLYRFNKNNENDLVVNIFECNNTSLKYNESFINNKDNKLVINNYIKGNNNESVINIRNICNNKKSEIDINVLIDKNTINNIALEDLKGINNGGFIHIEPNIICESNEVVANHLTTIGNLDKRCLDYLMGKGLPIKLAKEILLKGFIYSNMDDYIKSIFGGE